MDAETMDAVEEAKQVPPGLEPVSRSFGDDLRAPRGIYRYVGNFPLRHVAVANGGHFVSRSATSGDDTGQSMASAGSFHMNPDSCAGAYSVVVL